MGQPAAYANDQPGDGRERHDGRARQQGIEGQQHHAGADDHERVGDEVDERIREERAQVVGIRADARDEIAGAFAPEVLEAQPLQMGEGAIAQIGRHLLGDKGQDGPLPPGQEPRHHRGAREPSQIEEDRGQGHAGRELTRLARDQDLIDERHGQIRRNQTSRGARQGQEQAQQYRTPVRSGKAHEPEQGKTAANRALPAFPSTGGARGAGTAATQC